MSGATAASSRFSSAIWTPRRAIPRKQPVRADAAACTIIRRSRAIRSDRARGRAGDENSTLTHWSSGALEGDDAACHALVWPIRHDPPRRQHVEPVALQFERADLFGADPLRIPGHID